MVRVQWIFLMFLFDSNNYSWCRFFRPKYTNEMEILQLYITVVLFHELGPFGSVNASLRARAHFSVRVRLAMHCCQTHLITSVHCRVELLEFFGGDRFVRYIFYLMNFVWSLGNCYCLLLLISVVILLLLLTLHNWCFIWCVVIRDNP
jgi:hypothetical protein